MQQTYIITYNTKIKQHLPSHLKIWLALPQSNYLQKIDKLTIEPKSKSIYSDQSKNKIAYWQTNKPKFELKLAFDYQNAFLKQEIRSEKINQKMIPLKIKKQYTKSEPFLEQSPAIKSLAKKITSKKDNPYTATEKIFCWVAKNFTYQYPPAKRGVANLNFKNLHGDCAEYSGLFVALCRAIGILAKVDTGFWFNQNNPKLNEHAWASIYLHPYGWLPVDCQFASLEKTISMGKEKYFCNTPENRIIFINGFNIPLKPMLSKKDDISYWQKQTLIANNKSVQTLQPLFFTTLKENLDNFDQKFLAIKKREASSS